MNYKETEWNGYKMLEFEFEGQNALLVFPKTQNKRKKWLFKTEYFGAFPKFELEMLERGYYLAHVDNATRWCLDSDTERQADFAGFLSKEFGLEKKCVPVGMSCGGMQAVYLAAKHPELVAAIYLDAPVMNLLSCPGSVGASKGCMLEEFTNATNMTLADLINYRKHPIDYADKLLENDIPVFLVCGDSDTIVPYKENGEQLYNMYKEGNGRIELVLKPGCDHHPHGLEDCSPIVNFVEKNY